MNKFFSKVAAFVVIGLLIATLIAGWSTKRISPHRITFASAASASDAALAVALTPPNGDTPGDREISDLQRKVKSASDRTALLERLGWAYVAKARLTSDPGFYKIAEKCADAMETGSVAPLGAQLLRGHIYDALHRFKEAEKIARDLVARREFVLDFALLGDALMEQGKLPEAVDAYQRMVDLKPCLQTYSRVAHMRWLKGDLPGAIEVMRLAIASGSPMEPEPVAWACTQLARYEMQQGSPDLASGAVQAALQAVPEYRAALLTRGRLFLAQGNYHEAVAYLQRASADNPLPEYLWALADALRANNDVTGAEKVELQIQATGGANDPRGLSLFLASRALNPTEALTLAQAELDARRDIFTLDAIAWAELANGLPDKALKNIESALVEGTQDARLFYHAGAIFKAVGQTAKALDYLHRAKALGATLLPSERNALTQELAALIPMGSKRTLQANSQN